MLPMCKVRCFSQAVLRDPRVGEERADIWIDLRLGDLQDGYNGWTMVLER